MHFYYKKLSSTIFGEEPKIKKGLENVKTSQEVESVLGKIEHLDRLKKGFSWKQIKQILIEEGIIQSDGKEIDLQLSLTMDFLVNMGVIIPIQYLNKEINRLERRYRHGEDVVSAKRTIYLFSKILNYLRNQPQRLMAIPKEKILSMLWEKARRDGYIDTILAPQKPEEIIKLDIAYDLYGSVLQTEKGEYFSKLLEDPKYEISGSIAISPEALTSMEAFAKAAAYTEQNIGKEFEDEKRNGEEIYNKNQDGRYLITVSSLNDSEHYLDAIRAELEVFFEKYRQTIQGETVDIISVLIGFVRNLKNTEITRDVGKQKKQWLNKYKKNLGEAKTACKQIFIKKSLFYNSKKFIAETINNHFEEIDDLGYRMAYYFKEGYSFADRIRKIMLQEVESPHLKECEDQIKNAENKIFALGECCKVLSEIFISCRDILNFFLTRTEQRTIHPRSVGALQDRNKHIDELIPMLSKQLDNLRSEFLYGSPLEVVIALEPNVESTLLNVEKILQKMQYVRGEFEKIYKAHFGKEQWRKKKDRWFPLKKYENFYLVKYDIKKSTGTKKHGIESDTFIKDINNSVSAHFKEKIENKIIISPEDLNESGSFLIKLEIHNALSCLSSLILNLLQTAQDSSVGLRISISSSLDGNPFLWKRNYSYTDHMLITNAKDDNRNEQGIKRNYEISARLIDCKKTDLNEIETNNGLNKDTHTIVLSEQVREKFSNEKYKLETHKIHFHLPEDGPGSKNYNGFVIAKDSMEDFIRLLQEKMS